MEETLLAQLQSGQAVLYNGYALLIFRHQRGHLIRFPHNGAAKFHILNFLPTATHVTQAIASQFGRSPQQVNFATLSGALQAELDKKLLATPEDYLTVILAGQADIAGGPTSDEQSHVSAENCSRVELEAILTKMMTMGFGPRYLYFV